MNTFYSILYAPIRPSLDEKVSIALFLSERDKVVFHYSNTKLKIIKQLIPDAAFNLLKSYLKIMESKFSKLEGNGDILQLDLSDDKSDKIIKESYFNYLSRYSNNLISFSKPKTINLEVNQEVFNKLFEKYIFQLEELVDDKNILTVFQKVKKSLFPKIEHTVNIDRHLTANEIPNLFVPTDVDFIGANENPVTGHTFDFLKSHYYLENDVARFVGLAKAFELNGEKNGKYYVIGKEPSKRTHSTQHKTWKIIHESKFLDFVPLTELDKIDEYIKSHEVQPYFNKVD